MPAVVQVPAKDMKSCLDVLALLAPKGSDMYPVGVDLKNGTLSMVCASGCILKSTIPVAGNDVAHITMLYYDVSQVVPKTGMLNLEINDFGVKLAGTDFDCTFPVGFSEVQDYDLESGKFQDIGKHDWATPLRLLLNMGFEKLYKQSLPFTVNGRIAAMEYPCSHVYVRMLGIPFSARLDQAHIRLLLRLKPTQVSDSSPGTLIFKEGNNFVQIPCKVNVGDVNYMKFLEDMKVISRFNVGDYLESVKNVSKVSSKSDCSMTFFPSGMSTTVRITNVQSTVHVGNTNEDVAFACKYPIEVWLSFLKALGQGTVEVLIGGGKLCLRTQSLIILTRVLS